MNIDNITNIEIEDVHTWDYPDLVDAFIANASWKDTGKELTDEELEQLNKVHRDFVHEQVLEQLH